MANAGPLPQADLLALYRRLIAATRALEARDRAADREPPDDELERASLRATGPTTRFAPAPTGYLHLGHVANAVAVWGMARAAGRPRDPADRGPRPPALPPGVRRRAARGPRPGSGSSPTSGPLRQSDDDAPYEGALETLRAAGLVYGCDCSRSTFDAWAAAQRPRVVGLRAARAAVASAACDGPVLRVALGGGEERWMDGVRRAVRGRGVRRGRPADPRPPRQLDLRVRGRRRRPAARASTWSSAARPPRGDAGPDPARLAARRRRAGDLRPPPADPAAGRAQALEVRRGDRGPRAPGRGPSRARR